MTRGLARMVAAGIVLLGTVGPAAAATYRWVDDDGVIYLTNSQTHFENHLRRRGLLSPAAPVFEPPPPSSTLSTAAERKLKETLELRRVESVSTEVMRLSGLTVQIDLLAMLIFGEFNRMRSLGLQPASGAVPLLAETFGAEPLRANMQDALGQSLDPERSSALLAWLRTPLSGRIVELECALPTAERQTELRDFVNQLPSTPPAPGRLTLIHRLERAADVTQGSAVVLTAAGSALRKTLRPFVPATAPAALTQPDRAPYPVIDETARLRTMLSLLFTYRDLSDSELGRYVSFLESPIGRWFTRATQSAFLTSLDPFDQPRRGEAPPAAGRRPKPSEAAATAGARN